jgi:8-oxo-dGTP pyrophosphatase MutT (NUDIX family)
MTGPGEAAPPARISVGRATNARTHRRDAVRAIVLDDVARLLLLAEAGGSGLKFPGGGVQPGESDLEALERELREETGYALGAVHGLAVVVDERRPGLEAGVDLVMQSRYYRVSVGELGSTALEDDERALGLAVVRLTVPEAVERQRGHAGSDPQPWAQRELAVLERLAAQSEPREAR